MADFNQVNLMGRLTRAVELRTVRTGTAVATLGLAVNDRVKRDGEWTDETTYVDVTAWGRTAENAAKHLAKGSGVFITGRLKLDQWEKDGQKRSKITVVADRVVFLPQSRKAGGGGSPAADELGDEIEMGVDIPF